MVLATLVPRRLAWFVPILLSLAIAPGCTSSYELTYPEPRPLGPVLPSVVTATDEGEMFGEFVDVASALHKPPLRSSAPSSHTRITARLPVR